jgi:hypothetical protein
MVVEYPPDTPYNLDYQIHNAGVGGSSPPMTTIFFNKLPVIFPIVYM